MFCAEKINLTCADLGRHIKNGEIFLTQFNPITTSFYSYTQPQYPTVTHHWGTGVIFYLLHKYFGFNGLSIFYILINLFAFLFFFKVAERTSNFTYALFFSVLSVPLVASRREIRPEGFSYLLLSVYAYLLYQFRGKISFKIICIFALLQALWVNLHIFFIMGPLLIFFFLCESWLNKSDKKIIKQYFLLLVVTETACLINPFGIKGALVPLTTLREFRYMVAENQSVIFMQKRFSNPMYLYFEVIFAVMALSFAGIILKRRLKTFIASLLLAIFFSALSWRVIRGIPMFALFFIPITAGNFHSLLQSHSAPIQKNVKYALGIVAIFLVLALGFVRFHYASFMGRPGIGLLPGTNLSAYFFKQHKIEGPIFNNYDIGGYLIYHFFPEHRVFVDNSGAYSSSFLKDIYIPMQENEDVWDRVDRQYNFNVIYFYRHDFTPWAQPFLIKRLQDSKWAPVFVDGYTLILLKRNEKNRRIIQLYELPKHIFQIVK